MSGLSAYNPEQVGYSIRVTSGHSAPMSFQTELRLNQNIILIRSFSTRADAATFGRMLLANEGG